MFSAKYIANQSLLLILSTDDLAQHSFKMCIFSRKYPYSPMEGIGNFLEVQAGFCKTITFEEMCEA